MQAKAMVSTLYRQLNTAIQDGAAQEAARGKLQQEVERLKAQLAEAQKLAHVSSTGQALEPLDRSPVQAHPGKSKGDSTDMSPSKDKD